jgi:membrane protein DedA with SNARE-associated domain
MHAYWVVALIVGLESVGLPLPGETILVLAAIYAATDPSFNLWLLIAVLTGCCSSSMAAPAA